MVTPTLQALLTGWQLPAPGCGPQRIRNRGRQEFWLTEVWPFEMPCVTTAKGDLGNVSEHLAVTMDEDEGETGLSLGWGPQGMKWSSALTP